MLTSVHLAGTLAFAPCCRCRPSRGTCSSRQPTSSGSPVRTSSMRIRGAWMQRPRLHSAAHCCRHSSQQAPLGVQPASHSLHTCRCVNRLAWNDKGTRLCSGSDDSMVSAHGLAISSHGYAANHTEQQSSRHSLSISPCASIGVLAHRTDVLRTGYNSKSRECCSVCCVCHTGHAVELS